MPALIDLTGKKFGRLTVLKRNKEIQQQRNDREPWWDCICDCGKNFSARGHDLRDNKILSCGCLKKENTRNINYKDLTNQQFGKLTVLKEIPDKRKSNRIVWLCQCECGNIVEISSKSLIVGTISCGCVKSKGELQLIKLLQELNINFISQYSPKECKNQKQLSFDFYLPQLNKIIEYNGKQHYVSIDYFGGEDRLKHQTENDTIKKQWCKDNNIELIVIPYNDYSILNINYLKEKLNID